MKAFCICLALLLAAGTASAQMYRWVDKDGKTRYGDTPPPGAKATTLGAPASGSAPAAPAAAPKDAASKDAKKGPLTAAEKNQEFRKREETARKDQEKAEQERADLARKAENCSRARAALSTLESGARIMRTNATGERYVLEDSERTQETAKAQQAVKESCAN